MKSSPRPSRLTALVFLALATAILGGAPPGHYTLTADTALDTKTGLTWQRGIAGWNGQDGARLYWTDAAAYCAQLNLGGFAAGQWRLPRKLELESIVDFTNPYPAVDLAAFPNTPSATAWFWTSTPVASQPGEVWEVNFTTGNSQQGHATDASNPSNNDRNYVRCVR